MDIRHHWVFSRDKSAQVDFCGSIHNYKCACIKNTPVEIFRVIGNIKNLQMVFCSTFRIASRKSRARPVGKWIVKFNRGCRVSVACLNTTTCFFALANHSPVMMAWLLHCSRWRDKDQPPRTETSTKTSRRVHHRSNGELCVWCVWFWMTC